MLDRVRLRIRSVVLRRRLEREMQEEMAGHLERSTERLMARGLSAEEARREAVREFGNVGYLQEEGRLARGTGWLDALAADLRFALRQFARRPWTTLTMLGVLSVGLCISTLLFSYVHSYATLPPVGVAREDDLVRIRGGWSGGAEGPVGRDFPEEEFLEYRKLTGPFRAVAGWADAMVALDAGSDVERRGLDAKASFVTENYFSVLGVRPVLGPGLPARESGDATTAAVAVIGHTAWDQLFARSPDVIGSTVAVNGVPVTIVGVAPQRFMGVGMPSQFVLWMPLSAQRLVMPGPPGALRAAARLRPGVGAREATAAVQVVGARAAASGEKSRTREATTDVVPLLSVNGDPGFDRDVRLMSFSIGFLGLLVLLVACTNVSALLTGLATARRQEIAIRLSLGAARTRLIRQLLTESALLSGLAGAAALGMVWGVMRAVNRSIPEMPLELEVNRTITAFTFGVALTVGVLFGLSPALHATQLGIASALRDSTAMIAAARGRLQRGLVVAQIAFTQPLVVLLAAVLLIILGTYRPQSSTEHADRLVAVSLRPPRPITGEDSGPAGAVPEREVAATTHRLVQQLRDTPGVEAVVLNAASTPPPGAHVVYPADRVDGVPRQGVYLVGETAPEGYFAMMGIPLVRGREFTAGDARAGEPRAGEVPVILGADLARRLWAGADPLGRRLRPAGDSAGAAGTLVVVGVIDDPRARAKGAGEDYRVYLPVDTSRVSPRVLLRTAGDALPLLPAIRRVVQETAPGMAVQVSTVAQMEAVRMKYFRATSGGFTAAGLMALLLSAIGLYAVVAFSVGQRTGEIAVRIAVGARARQIAQRFVADGLRLSAYGLAFGLPASLLGLRFLLTLDDDIPQIGLAPVTAIAALGVVLVAVAAAWIPARRAAAVDPAITLRQP